MSLVIGCVAVLVAGYVIYLAQVPHASPFAPQPTFSRGPGGLYDPGVTVVPMPPATHDPATHDPAMHDPTPGDPATPPG